MNHVVVHCRKIKTTVGLKNVAAHNNRENVYDSKGKAVGKLPEWISHPERAQMNEGTEIGWAAVLKNRGDRIQDANLLRKPQKNAAAAVEVVVSGSPEWFEGKSEEKWKAYFRDARRFLEARYGRENVLHWATHFDEKTPHMHVVLVPIVQGKVHGKDGFKYSSGDFLGGRGGLRDLQDQIAEQVGKKYGLARGIEGSTARHTDQYQWSATLANKEKTLVVREAAILPTEAEQAQREEELKKKMADFLNLATAPIEEFKLTLPKKKALSGLYEYEATDGTVFKSWDKYLAREVEIQANQHLKMMASQVKSMQTKWQRAAEVDLPYMIRHAEALQKKVNDLQEYLNNITPKQLRYLADQKEAELTQQQQRQKDNSRGHGY